MKRSAPAKSDAAKPSFPLKMQFLDPRVPDSGLHPWNPWLNVCSPPELPEVPAYKK